MPRDLLAGRDLLANRQSVSTVGDVVRGAASGIARSIPQSLDIGGAAFASIYDGATGGGNSYWKSFLQPAQTPMNGLADKVFGPEYQPQTGWGSLAKFAGGLVGPGDVASGARALKAPVGVLRGLAGKAPEYVSNPAVLLDRYKQGVESLKDIQFTPKQLREGLTKPVNEAIRPDFFPNKSPDLANDLKNLDALTKRGADGRRMEGYRRSLSSTKDPLANRLREGVDTFFEGENVPAEFRDQYRLMGKVNNLNDALDKGGDNLSMARTAVKSQLTGKNARGLKPAERQVLARASRSGVGEKALRLGSYVTGLPSAIASGNPLGAAGIYGTSRLLKMAADRAGLKRLEDARNLILNGGEMPTMAERFGTFVRGKLR